MVNKIIFILFFICLGSYAIAKENRLDYSIVSLLGVQDYKVNQKFIQKLFENQEEFLNGVG